MFNRARPITLKMPVLQTPESFKGGTFKAGLPKHCASLTVYSLVSVAITTFDLTTDWLTFASVRELQLDKKLQDKGDMLHKLYIALPHLFLVFCILASIIYAIDVIHYFYKFGTFRKKFYDKRDGVKNEESLVERFGGEVCVLLLVVFEDLPMSLLILAVQGLVSCGCLIMLNTPVLYLSVVATLTSVVWKLAQVAWSNGCCGKRYEYHSNRTIGALRIVSCLLLSGVLAVNILNCVLIKPNAFIHVMPGPDHSLFDKVFIDKWIEQDRVVFMESMHYADDDYNDNQHHNNNNPPIGMQYSTIVSLNDIILQSNINASVRITKKCNEPGSDMNFTKFMTTNDSSQMQDYSECEAMFLFYYNTSSETIMYDYGYRILRPSSGSSCVSGSFQDTVMMQDSDQHQATETTTSAEPMTSSTFSSTSVYNSNETNISTTAKSPGKGQRELAHHVTLISSMATGTRAVTSVTKPCRDIHLAHQSMRSFNPCLFVKSEM